MSKKYQGAITLKEAQDRFINYYNKRNKTKSGRVRGKLFDAMYQKKPKFTLEPNQPGSEKYLLEEGPRTFDMVGVDSFPEGQEFSIDNGDSVIRGTSKGATRYNSNLDKDENKVYGPRLRRKTGEHRDKLYSDYFKDKLKEREDPIIVKEYWRQWKNEQHKDLKDQKLKRKNKKPVNLLSLSDRNLITINTKNEYTLDEPLRNIYKVDIDTLELFEFDTGIRKFRFVGILSEDDVDSFNYVDSDLSIYIITEHLNEEYTIDIESGNIKRLDERPLTPLSPRSSISSPRSSTPTITKKLSTSSKNIVLPEHITITCYTNPYSEDEKLIVVDNNKDESMTVYVLDQDGNIEIEDGEDWEDYLDDLALSNDDDVDILYNTLESDYIIDCSTINEKIINNIKLKHLDEDFSDSEQTDIDDSRKTTQSPPLPPPISEPPSSPTRSATPVTPRTTTPPSSPARSATPVRPRTATPPPSPTRVVSPVKSISATPPAIPPRSQSPIKDTKLSDSELENRIWDLLKDINTKFHIDILTLDTIVNYVQDMVETSIQHKIAFIIECFINILLITEYPESSKKLPDMKTISKDLYKYYKTNDIMKISISTLKDHLVSLKIIDYPIPKSFVKSAFIEILRIHSKPIDIEDIELDLDGEDSEVSSITQKSITDGTLRPIVSSKKLGPIKFSSSGNTSMLKPKGVLPPISAKERVNIMKNVTKEKKEKVKKLQEKIVKDILEESVERVINISKKARSEDNIQELTDVVEDAIEDTHSAVRKLVSPTPDENSALITEQLNIIEQSEATDVAKKIKNNMDVIQDVSEDQKKITTNKPDLKKLVDEQTKKLQEQVVKSALQTAVVNAASRIPLLLGDTTESPVPQSPVRKLAWLDEMTTPDVNFPRVQGEDWYKKVFGDEIQQVRDAEGIRKDAEIAAKKVAEELRQDEIESASALDKTELSKKELERLGIDGETVKKVEAIRQKSKELSNNRLEQLQSIESAVPTSPRKQTIPLSLGDLDSMFSDDEEDGEEFYLSEDESPINRDARRSTQVDLDDIESADTRESRESKLADIKSVDTSRSRQQYEDEDEDEDEDDLGYVTEELYETSQDIANQLLRKHPAIKEYTKLNESNLSKFIDKIEI